MEGNKRKTTKKFSSPTEKEVFFLEILICKNHFVFIKGNEMWCEAFSWKKYFRIKLWKMGVLKCVN